MSVEINEILKALSNPTRRAILQWLREPEKHFPPQPLDMAEYGVCVGRIQEKAGLSQSTTSLYLATLQRANLVSSQRHGQWTYYKRENQTILKFIRVLEESL
ncbi:metalloregulator ArsR/SmtB family transcription factor [Kiloniella laminariae]|uniref:Metalloregulator ArsR/SmtB family transcription factor n=1 Tax=Kiloniella laminariae TaxID=454162 RepID=A0ABT4LJY1_9PROT|nr:metalloregulator ArsR/SmtB family transcription factor [Kiloniella laminariae]MCZ4281418.1 metalloregulator ArsR/SmtB family transcription factor [Kiloniella laminariae]